MAAGGSDGRSALVRYRPDGSLDPTFGIGGKVTTDFESFIATAFALVLQPDGKLVAAGTSDPGPFTPRFALARYRPDGSLDPTFGIGGKVTTDFDGGAAASALVLQPDGTLVAAGCCGGAGDADFVLARYRPDGSLDPTFGVGGKVTTDFEGTADFASDLILQPDGRLVAAGASENPISFGRRFALARYRPDGRLDATFGMEGRVTTDLGGDGSAEALVLQPDGTLVAAGASDGRFALVRYRPDGSLDPTFGMGGTVTTDFGAVGPAAARALVLQPDDKLVAAGEAILNDTWDFALARYRPDGRLDPAFGAGGVVNALVTFDPIPATFTFTPDPTGCPEGFVGTFSFEARLTNSSESALTDLVIAVTTLTNGNLLQNADGSPGGVGARLTVPEVDGFTDGLLSPDEFVDVPFVICLTQQQPFTFVVDVRGVVEANTDTQAKAQPVR